MMPGPPNNRRMVGRAGIERGELLFFKGQPGMRRNAPMMDWLSFLPGFHMASPLSFALLPPIAGRTMSGCRISSCSSSAKAASAAPTSGRTSQGG